MKRMTSAALGCAVLAMAACAPATQAGVEASAGAQVGGMQGGTQAVIRNSQGQPVGTVRMMPHGNGTHLMVSVSGMPAGAHGAHLHAAGRCDAPDFTTAGPHWNPTNRQHGTRNPNGPHLGDLPNLVVASNGTGTLEAMVNGSMADADGTSLVIHANADDMVTDPSGNSGGRIACAVVGGAGM